MHSESPERHTRGEPSSRSLGVHLGMFLVLATALAVIIIVRPFEMDGIHLATVLILIGALVASSWFLTRQRFDAITDPGDPGS